MGLGISHLPRNYSGLDSIDKDRLRHYEKRLKKGNCEIETVWKERPELNPQNKSCGICDQGKSLYNFGNRTPKYRMIKGKRVRVQWIGQFFLDPTITKVVKGIVMIKVL